MDDEAGALGPGSTPPSWAAGAGTHGAPLAEQHVRDGDLEEAINAYREADRRAPQEERGAIANRIAWLLKETGRRLRRTSPVQPRAGAAPPIRPT